MTRDDWIWLAGFLDGEGHLTWGMGTPRVQITNTHRPTLAWIQDQVGGKVYTRTRVTRCRPAYEWVASGDAAREVLRKVLPYLREKQAQAYLVLSIPVSGRGRARTVRQWAEINRILDQLKALRHAVS